MQNGTGQTGRFIVRKYGTERFLKLYFAVHPGRFDESCKANRDVDLSTLESEFCSEVERLLAEN